MSDVTIEYVRDVVGHPDTGSVVTVEDTPEVQALITNGFAVQTSPGVTHEPPPDQDDEQPVADPPLRDDEQVAPDGSTAVSAESTKRGRGRAGRDTSE